MASSQEPTPQGPARQPWLEALTRRHRESAYGLFALAAAAAACAGWVIYKYRSDFAPVSAWAVVVSLIALGGGLAQLLRVVKSEAKPEDTTRLIVLTVGGLTGFVTALLGLVLPLTEWRHVFTGGLEVWRKEWWILIRCFAALFGGLALMFASLQLARSDARSTPWLRRLLYGYNAVLTGFLLLAILTVLNVVAYARSWPFEFFSTTQDFTSSGIYTLSPATKHLLESLKEDRPVTVYVILPTNDLIYRDLRTLMLGIQEVTNTSGKKIFNVEYLSPDLNLEDILALQQKYNIPTRKGLLVVYGKTGDEQQEFIQEEALRVVASAPGERFRYTFTGEDALVKALSSLSGGKAKPTIYVTQGHGELDLNDAGFEQPDKGLGILRDVLQRSNFDVKELRFGPNTTAVPEDATAVVLARPKTRLSDNALAALGSYMNAPSDDPRGKLLVLTDVVVNEQGNMADTGVERFLANFSVTVGNDRILNVNTRNPRELVAIPNPRSQNPIAKAFVEGNRVTPFQFYDARTVRPAAPAGPNPAAQRYRAEELLMTYFDLDVWAETNLRLDPNVLVSDLRKPANRETLRAKVSPDPLPLAVTVTFAKAGTDATDPHAFMRPPKEQKPRLLVFGDSSWVTNRMLMTPQGKLNSDLFISSLNWLRERPEIGTSAEHKERQEFTLQVTPDVASRLFWLPAVLMLVSIVGLGAGIWVVRRR